MKARCKSNHLEGPRLIRILRGFTQSGLGALISVDQAIISRYELGLPVSENARKKIEAALGIDKKD